MDVKGFWPVFRDAVGPVVVDGILCGGAVMG
jgi:hypothetical protein